MSDKVMMTLHRQKWEVEPGETAREAIRKLHLNPESYLVVRNGELVSADTILEPGDEVLLVAAISGGAVVLSVTIAEEGGGDACNRKWKVSVAVQPP